MTDGDLVGRLLELNFLLTHKFRSSDLDEEFSLYIILSALRGRAVRQRRERSSVNHLVGLIPTSLARIADNLS